MGKKSQRKKERRREQTYALSVEFAAAERRPKKDPH
jgi:hypothetical protein